MWAADIGPRRVPKDGRVLFVRDEDQLYELAFRSLQSHWLSAAVVAQLHHADNSRRGGSTCIRIRGPCSM